MDPSWLLGAQLLNPAAIMHKQQTQHQKQVMQPPTMFEYTNKDAEPHYLQETGNLKVKIHACCLLVVWGNVMHQIRTEPELLAGFPASHD